MLHHFISITYGITVNNEVEEIKKLLQHLIPLIKYNDEIIVLQDITVENLEVSTILKSYENKIKVIKNKLGGDFASFKNNLIAASSKKYLFQIDADEYPKKQLIKQLKKYLYKNRKFDCFMIPRINIVQGLTEQDVKKWNWNLNEKGYVNFPDFQSRIFKLNGNIQWKNKVHEVLINHVNVREMPIQNEDYCLVHDKQIVRQRIQNEFYETL